MSSVFEEEDDEGHVGLELAAESTVASVVAAPELFVEVEFATVVDVLRSWMPSCATVTFAVVYSYVPNALDGVHATAAEISWLHVIAVCEELHWNRLAHPSGISVHQSIISPAVPSSQLSLRLTGIACPRTLSNRP